MSVRQRRPGLFRTVLRRGGMVATVTALLTAVAGQPASAAPSGQASPRAVVDGKVLTELSERGSTQLLVFMREQADLSAASKLADRTARAAHVHQQLTATAEKSQRGLARELAARKVTYSSFWIANAIWVSGDAALVSMMAARSDVAKIETVRTYPLLTPVSSQVDPPHTNAVEWGVANIEAPRVWSEFGVRGEGIVVANIDSGVMYNHPALVGKYRGNLGNGQFDHNYNWFDPAHICGNPSVAPCDNNNHGTHTMGTMVGDDGAGNQIGVAPGARWIAAKGCETNGCSETSLLASGQWVIAPTDLNNANPRPDLHADVVNNSWGGDPNDLFYQNTVRAWTAAGIMPIFSNGNSGPACQTAGSPGDYPETYAAGAYDINNAIANFSSRGSSRVDGAIKPNIAAPGVNVRSSVPGGGYANFSGTSMAAPHVSGTVALLWSAAPSLKGDIAGTRALLDQGATDVDATACGGTAAKNNIFGEGRLNAFQTVFNAPRGGAGRVIGIVTDAANGSPIAGATVTAETFSVQTGNDGRYSLQLTAGDHVVTASKYGFLAQSANVTVIEGGATTQNFALAAAPVVTLSGRVTDGSGHGWPLYARIDIAGRPGGPVFTNPATGRYAVQIAGGASYRLTTKVMYAGYKTVVEDVVIGSTNVVHDIAVLVDPVCVAAGYTVGFSAPLLSEAFSSTSTPAGWSVVNRTAFGGWGFTDPGGRGNLTGGSDGFAMVDSDFLGIGNHEDTDLITPTLDLSATAAPVLRFNSDWRALGNGDSADVDASTDGGATWTTLWHQTANRRGPRVEEISLAPVAGNANVTVRFRFQGTWAWWWEVDNVTVVNRTCTPIPGGLVVGFTTDQNTGAALNGVAVSSVDAPADKGVSAPTPDDPNVPDGFFSLFSTLTGPHPFTATKAPYLATTKTVNVVGDDTVRSDFALRAGRLTVTPASIESFLTLRQTRTTTLTVTNTGSAPADVQLLERTGTFTILGQQGPAPTVVPMQCGVAKGFQPDPKLHCASGGGMSTSAAPDAPGSWSPIAPYPIPTSDNSAAVIGGKVYSVGGPNGSGNDNKAFVYDPDANAWSPLPNMPSARGKPAVAVVNGQLYVFGGWDAAGVPVASVDVFNPTTNTWSTLSASNPRPRAAAGTSVAGGKVYLTGGCINGACDESVDQVVFDPTTGAFTIGAPYPHPVSWVSCGSINDKVYCAGGVGATAFTDGFSYDPGSDSWTPIAGMPVDLWGSQYSSASGLLVLAGGITGNSTALTNRSIAYDPASNTWSDLPTAGLARARGAGACGVYKIGGWSSPFVSAPESERLSGLDQCDETADVPWLSENPAAFTINPGQRVRVTVTLAATADAHVLQPGDYTAQIAVRSNTPYAVSPVPVTMHVLPPATWGKITGTVLGQLCTGQLVGVPAFIQINLASNPDIGASIRAGNDGKYAWWLPRGRYQVIVAKDGWIPQVRMVRIDAGFVSVEDFTLKPFTPCP
jgi:subtilisin family serine protease